MKKWILICMLPISMSLTGCVHHWTQQECQTNNMRATGIMDGQNGRPVSQLNQYQKDCAKFQINLAASHYRRGWKSGNFSYCQPNHIFDMAKSGAGFPSVCGQTTSRMASFQRGTHIHSRLVTLRSRVNHINAELGQMRRVKNEYNWVLNDIASDRQIIAHTKNKKRRKQAKIDIRNKKDRLQFLKQQMRSIAVSGQNNPRYRARLENKRRQLQNRIDRLNRQ